MKVLIVGGAVVYSQNEIAQLAFSVLSKPPKITHILAWMAGVGIKALGLFNRHAADLLDFFVTAGPTENVAPQLGTHTLEDHFWALPQSNLTRHG